MHRRLAAILLVLCAALCTAQVATRYTVAGTVVNSATGEPIRRALVAVGAALVFTGGDGRFRVEDVPAGAIQIAAQKPGYFECATAGCSPQGSAARIMINVQSAISDVSLKLIPESKIEGRVTDEEGEPISGVQVQILGEHIVDGWKELRADSGGATDENGNYKAPNLLPGTYRVRTFARPAYLSDTGTGTPAQVYAPRFYPNTPDASAAQPLDLQAGQAARANFTLTPVRSFRISGSVAPPVPRLAITASDTDDDPLNPPVEYDPKSGKFTLVFMPAGTWILNFQEIVQEDSGASATQAVTLSTTDVTGLHILLQAPISIPVNLVNGPARVQIISADRSLRSGIAGAPGAPGNAWIAGVVAGTYRVTVNPSDAGCIDSVISGNLDLTREDLIVASGSPPQAINVTLRNDCASLRVVPHVPNRDGRATIVVVPASRALEPLVSEMDASSPSHVFTDLSPGEYQVYAFSSIDGLEYANPEAMRDFSSQQITLNPNEHTNIALDVIVR